MHIKMTVKFSEKGHLLVDLPYKHGSVTWALNFNSNKMEWILFQKPGIYSPARVLNDHRTILHGKKLRMKMIAKSSATHQYTILEKLRMLPRREI